LFHVASVSGRRLLSTSVVVVVAFVLAACGSGSDSGSSSESGTPEVTIGKAVDTIGFTTVEVAQAEGYFKEQGVSVKKQVLGGSSTAFAALQSGDIQFVTASSTALLNARASGVPLMAVAGLDYGVSMQLLASNDWIEAHDLSPDQPLETVMKGLEGAALGVISTTVEVYYDYLMQAADVDPEGFTYISLDGVSAALAALEHNQIDAFLLSPPSTFFAQEQGSGTIIASLSSVPELREMTYDILVVTSDYAEENPDVVESVATAMAMANNVMANDPESVLHVEKEHYPKMAEDVLLQSLKYVTFTPDGKMSEEGWEAAKQVAEQLGIDVSSVDVSPSGGVWTNDFISTEGLSSK
jgi:NitT/TauT family transport system substrate-binding protein